MLKQKNELLCSGFRMHFFLLFSAACGQALTQGHQTWHTGVCRRLLVGLIAQEGPGGVGRPRRYGAALGCWHGAQTSSTLWPILQGRARGDCGHCIHRACIPKNRTGRWLGNAALRAIFRSRLGRRLLPTLPNNHRLHHLVFFHGGLVWGPGGGGQTHQRRQTHKKGRANEAAKEAMPCCRGEKRYDHGVCPCSLWQKTLKSIKNTGAIGKDEYTTGFLATQRDV